MKLWKIEFDLFIAVLINLSMSDVGLIVCKALREVVDILWTVAKRAYGSIQKFILDALSYLLDESGSDD